MLHMKFQTSGTSCSEEYFDYISMHFYGSNLGPPCARPSWILEPSFAQTW